MGRFSNWWQNVGKADYSGEGDENAESGKWDSQYDDREYPKDLEHFHPDSRNVPVPHAGVVTIKDALDYEIRETYGGPYIQGGQALTHAMFSTGVVEPTNVDAHYLDGSQAIIRRMADTNFGPVATSDHNSLLSLLHSMQESSAYYPNEASQLNVIQSV